MAQKQDEVVAYLLLWLFHSLFYYIHTIHWWKKLEMLIEDKISKWYKGYKEIGWGTVFLYHCSILCFLPLIPSTWERSWVEMGCTWCQNYDRSARGDDIFYSLCSLPCSGSLECGGVCSWSFWSARVVTFSGYIAKHWLHSLHVNLANMPFPFISF